MARADLRTSIRNSTSGRNAFDTSPSIAPIEAAPSAPEAVAPPVPSRRTLKGRLFGRFADYFRRYLTDGIQHRLNLIQAEHQEVRALVAAHTHALDHAIVVHADHNRRVMAQQVAELDARISRMETIATAAQAKLNEAITAAIVEREKQREARTSLQLRLDEVIAASLVNREIQRDARAVVEASIRSSQIREERIQAQMGTVEQRLVAVLDNVGSLGAMGSDIGVIAGNLGAMQADTAATRSEIGALPALFGPRLDEIEIKLRPFIEFDDESYAIRVREAYVLISRREPTLALMIANATSGGLEPGVRRVLTSLALPGMRTADVGANVGLLTLAMASAVGPTGKVWSFEPQADVMHQLRKTLQLNGLRWVEAVELAAGAKADTLTFNVSPIIGHSSLYELPVEEGTARKVEVKVVSMDEFIPKGESLDLVKIDVEGAELDVLAGMKRLLKENKDLAIVAEFGPSHLARVGIGVDEWFEAFEAHGLTPYGISEPDGRCTPVDRQTAASVVSLNIAFVRKGGAAEARLPR